MNRHFLSALTISEFQLLTRTGEVRIDPTRVLQIQSGWEYSEEGLSLAGSEIAQKLPEIDPEEAHSVVVVEFTERATSILPEIPGARVWFRIDHLVRFFALTNEASQIVESRLGEIGVNPERPILEAWCVPVLQQIKYRCSLFGARALVHAITGRSDYEPRWMAVGNEKAKGIKNPVLESILGYTRHESWGEEPLSAVKDLGTILKEQGVLGKTKEGALDLLRDACRAAPAPENNWLSETLAAPLMVEALNSITREWELPVEAGGLVLLLYWAYLGQKAVGVDIDGVLKNCKEVSELYYEDTLCDAVWLLGFHSGFESFSIDWLSRLGTAAIPPKKGSDHQFAELRPRPKEKPEEKPSEKPEEKPEEKTEEKPKEKTEEKPKEKTEEKPKEKTEEKPEEKPSEKPEEKPEEEPEEKPEERRTCNNKNTSDTKKVDTKKIKRTEESEKKKVASTKPADTHDEEAPDSAKHQGELGFLDLESTKGVTRQSHKK